MDRLIDNAPRFRAGSDHVESWFIRANDPAQPRALWLKTTVLCRRDGPSVAEAWCTVFDGDRTLAIRRTVPFDPSAFSGGRRCADSRAGGHDNAPGRRGRRASGRLDSDQGQVSWDLDFAAVPGALGSPMSLLPSRRLIDAPFPKNKLLTPFPVARFGGWLDWNGERWDLTGWAGMQGHNWGQAHSPEYAWGQCIFPDDHGEPEAVVEGASGRIILGPVSSPLLSMLVVRRDGKEYRFDRLLDLWRQHPTIDFPQWRLRMAGSAGRATVWMRAEPARMVCLGYDNPAGDRSHCLNSKTAQVRVLVEPRGGEAFECASEHAGALELQPHEEPSVQPVV